MTDRRRLCPGARTISEEIAALDAQIDLAIEAGVDMIQIRERDLPASLLLDLTRRAVARARGSAVRVLVNDRADVALSGDANGVHLRADGPPVERMRALGPDHWIVGRSVHHVRDVAVPVCADYWLAGTVFPSASKAPRAPTLGIDGLGDLVSAARAPVLAIGGVDPARAAACRAVGAAGIAAIGAFLPERAGGLGVTRATQAFREALAGPARGFSQ